MAVRYMRKYRSGAPPEERPNHITLSDSLLQQRIRDRGAWSKGGTAGKFSGGGEEAARQGHHIDSGQLRLLRIEKLKLYARTTNMNSKVRL